MEADIQGAGERIPLCARITALADVYDALTIIIYEMGEEHFDPRI